MSNPSNARLIDLLPYQIKHFPQEDCLAAKENPNAQNPGDQWVRYSSVQCLEYANQVGLSLLSLGIKPGDKISIVSENRPEWVLTELGILQLGAVNVPLYPTISEREYEFILNDSGVKVVFVSNEEIYEKIKDVQPKVSSLKHIISFEKVDGAENWTDFLERSKEKDINELNELKNKVNPQDLATIIYTSGTTGNPKGVMLTHHNVVSNVDSCVPLLPVDYRHKALSFLPLNHSFEHMLNFLYIRAGISVYYAESMDTIGDNLREIKPQIFTAVPRLLEKVYQRIINKGRDLKGIKKALFFYAVKLGSEYELEGKDPWYKLRLSICDKLVFSKWREALGGNARAVVSGSAALAPHLARVFTAAGITILEGYGLTETAPVIAVNRMEKEYRKFGTVGLVISGVEVKISEEGEILCKGPNVMKGYYNNEKATRESFTEDGWFKTGDIGEYDGKFLKIIDRKDSLFKTSGGKFIAPMPIEERLKQSFFIEQAMVIGKGQRFAACLIIPDFHHLNDWCKKNDIPCGSKEEAINNEQVIEKYTEIVESVNVNFSRVGQVKKFRLLPDEWSVDSGELTPTLKYKRGTILNKYKDTIDALYAEEEYSNS